MKIIAVLFLLSSVLVVTSLAPRRFVEFSKPRHAPDGWTATRRSDKDAPVKLIFALKQRNLDILEEKFRAVSDPKSDSYAQYLTIEEITEIVAPEEEAVSTLLNWLMSHNVEAEVTANRDFVLTTVTVEQVEKLLHVELYDFVQEGSGIKLIRTLDAYSLPVEVAEVVQLVGGVIRFPKVNKLRVTPLGATPEPFTSITPSVVHQVLNVTATGVGASNNNSQAVNQFLRQYYAPSDLAKFEQQFSLPQNKVAKEVGPNDPSDPGLEASLDIEYIMGVAVNVPTWFISTGGEEGGQEPFLAWLAELSNSTSPWVLSVSYGEAESSRSPSYVQRVSAEFQKLGLRGVSILFASGDDGVGCDSRCNAFEPNFPASSPYVTAVGGVVLEQLSPLRVVGDSISSGGFSNDYPGPETWQAAAVSAYLSSGVKLPAQSYWNASGRAVPDVASFSENVIIVVGGEETGVAGTSCAAPVVSGVIALINDARLSAGKPTLGFLNPLLYQAAAAYPAAFLDITQGNNADSCCPGFNAYKGWDPVTGLGVPNFGLLAQAIDEITSGR